MLWVGICIIGYAVVSILSSLMFGGVEEEILIVYLLVGGVGVVFMIIGLFRGKKGKTANSRTTYEHRYENSENFKKSAERILSKDGYYVTQKNGEKVWEKNIPGTPNYKYIKIECCDHQARISGWLGGIGNEELNLNGFVGCLPKAQVKRTIKKILREK